MGILDKIHLFIFKVKENPENSDFDLKELQENIRKRREKEANEKKRIDQKISETHHEACTGDSKIIREVTWKPDSLKTSTHDKKISEEILQVKDPLLLSVKMFLSEIPYIIKGYYDLNKNNCLSFSKDVQDAATKRGIRCGLVTMSFQKSLTGHAIVAFETDYGLKFFEPQSANEEDVKIGRRYSSTLSDISDDDIITRIEISWNDETHTIIE